MGRVVLSRLIGRLLEGGREALKSVCGLCGGSWIN